MNTIKSLLCDIDGTLLYRNQKNINQIYPGVVETIKELKKKIRVFYVTNTTSQRFSQILEELNDLGIPCSKEELFTPGVIAQKNLVKRGFCSGIGFFAEKTKSDYTWFTQDSENGNTVLVGDEGLDLTFRDVQKAFRLLMKGAELFAFQKNRFYRGSDGLCIDLGPLVSALEYGSDKKAEVFGKPSKTLFNEIANQYKIKLTDMAIIGDDAEFDIYHPMQLGIKGILVKTGKYLSKTLENLNFNPDLVVDNFSDVLKFIS